MDIHNIMMVEIQKLHDTESQLVQALGFLGQRAQDEDLRKALGDHRLETMEHVRRLEQICMQMGWQATGQRSTVAEALVEEARQLLQDAPPSPITDACIIGAAQKAEHFEIACYGTAAAMADAMDNDSVKDLLHKTLEEEKDADKRLSKIATHAINAKAVETSTRASVM